MASKVPRKPPALDVRNIQETDILSIWANPTHNDRVNIIDRALMGDGLWDYRYRGDLRTEIFVENLVLQRLDWCKIVGFTPQTAQAFLRLFLDLHQDSVDHRLSIAESLSRLKELLSTPYPLVPWPSARPPSPSPVRALPLQPASPQPPLAPVAATPPSPAPKPAALAPPKGKAPRASSPAPTSSPAPSAAPPATPPPRSTPPPAAPSPASTPAPSAASPPPVCSTPAPVGPPADPVMVHFSRREMELIADHLAADYYRVYNLYQRVFREPQPVQAQTETVLVARPLPRVRPLAQAITLQAHQEALKRAADEAAEAGRQAALVAERGRQEAEAAAMRAAEEQSRAAALWAEQCAREEALRRQREAERAPPAPHLPADVAALVAARVGGALEGLREPLAQLVAERGRALAGTLGLQLPPAKK
ncbi:hypothetical protein PAPYR_3451 [Paratrimastix pyriformis]|uniref:Uncharacterized protein n=1 Tax=Paratrimastix pyriformis TaxID=342808 RepID=A0ABQ8UNM9_9EUKA|nr:hypothetical protein PAPYR_3451 [Paratrimastix pyriformis]